MAHGDRNESLFFHFAFDISDRLAQVRDRVLNLIWLNGYDF